MFGKKLSIVFSLLACTTTQSLGQDLELLFDRSELQNYTIGSNAGVDEQTVDPALALSSFGNSFGASAWRSRVENDMNYTSTPADGPCSLAVKALYREVCGSGRSGCPIEATYSSTCVNNLSGSEQDMRCVKVVDDYLAQCFGNSCMSGNQFRHNIQIHAVLKGNSSGTCSSTIVNVGELPSLQALQFNYGEPFESVPVSAAHCQHRSGDTADRKFDGQAWPRQIEDRLENQSGLNSNVVVLPTKGPTDSSMGLAAPEEFRETALLGFNALVELRNKVAQRNGIAEVPTVVCDGSPLCTVVQINSGDLTHTCQSSSGTSGGPILQNIAQDGQDPEWRIVGINEGSDGTGIVNSNKGWRLLQ